MELSHTEERPELRVDNTGEFLRGCAISFFIFIVFVIAQNYLVLKDWCAMKGLSMSAIDLSMVKDQNVLNELTELTSNGDTLGRISLWSGVVGVGLLLLCVFGWKKAEFNKVLGLRLFSIKHFFIFLGLFAAAMLFQQFSLSFAGIESEFMIKVMSSVTDTTILLLGVGIMAPIFEELLLRGVVLYSVQRVSNDHVAIAVSSVIFAMLHVQYAPWVMLTILPLGVVLGYARVKSKSIVLPIVLHIANNSIAVLFFDQLG